MLRRCSLQYRHSSNIPLKVKVTPGSQPKQVETEDPRLYKRKRCEGSTPFDGMGEVGSTWDTDPHIIKYWHKNISLIPEIELRMHDDGEMFYEDRPHARSLQMPQIKNYIELLKSNTNFLDCDTPTVMDVGANIGVFATHIKSLKPHSRIFCIEPIPSSCSVLRTNLERYDVDQRPVVLNCGVSDSSGFKEFKVLKGSSQSATCQPPNLCLTAADAAKAIENDSDMSEIIASSENDYLQRAFNSQVPETVTVEVRAISSLITSHQVNVIDLLKIDTEASELSVLEGISVEHFPIIKNIILEIHTRQRVNEITKLLSQHGFTVVTNPLKETIGCRVELFLMCASRNC